MPTTMLPRAPRTLNTAAPAYARLAALFDHPEVNSLHWCYVKPTELGAQLKTTPGVTLTDSFTQTAMNQVCPELFEVLLLAKKRTVWSIICEATTYWQHCREPGILYETTPTSDVYIRSVDAVHSFRPSRRLCTIDYTMYMITFENLKARKQTKISAPNSVPQPNQESTEWKICGMTTTPQQIAQRDINIDTLEAVIPGFSERIQLAMDLGLAPNDVADYVTNSKKILASKEYLSLQMPEELLNKE